MFSNSINSSLIGFVRPIQEGKAGRRWQTRADEGAGGDRFERKCVGSVLSSGVGHPVGLRQTSSHLRPQDTTRADRSPSPRTEDNRKDVDRLAGTVVFSLESTRVRGSRTSACKSSTFHVCGTTYRADSSSLASVGQKPILLVHSCHQTHAEPCTRFVQIYLDIRR